MENTQRKYQIRRKILEAMVEFDQACRSRDLIDFSGFMFLKPTLEELAEQWKALRLAEYIESLQGFDGEYCKITAAGLRQVNPEFEKNVFVWGPQAL